MVVTVAGAPDFGPEYGEAIRKMVEAMRPLLEEHSKVMSTMMSRLAASDAFLTQQESIRKFAASMASTLSAVSLPVLAPETVAGLARMQAVTSEMLAAQLPDMSVLSRFGEMVARGELAADVVQAAHEVVDGVEGYQEAIADFSIRATIAQVFDPKTIAEGVYIFVFIVWLVGSLWIAGLSEEAKSISDAVGLTGVAGSHSVAKYVSTKTTKVVIKKRNTRRR